MMKSLLKFSSEWLLLWQALHQMTHNWLRTSLMAWARFANVKPLEEVGRIKNKNDQYVQVKERQGSWVGSAPTYRTECWFEFWYLIISDGCLFE
jgi:hypothetical protein